ncbi:MAG: extracellular solute-binding protein [Lachnospiraceae bacterium]|nr:extracellular solute-binding protein [Lachnospiraceae bacterium]
MRKSGRKQWKNGKRLAALWLAGVLMVSLAGCGNQSGEGKDGADRAVSEPGEMADGSVAMGRYVETMLDLDTGEILDLKELSDGRLALLENGAEGRWISEDNGLTWKPDELPGWYDLAMDYYIYDMKAAPDGSVAILCKSFGSMSGAEDESEEEKETEDSGEPAAEDETEDSGEPAAEDETEHGESANRICLIPAQGETQWFDVPTGDYEIAASLCFSEDGSRLFVASMDQKIYEVDPAAGTTKLFMTVDITPDMFCVWENYMAFKNEREGVVLYHLDTLEQIEDDVIMDFVKENCAVNNKVAESTYSIFPAEEEGIYLVCSKGVYRHVIGGTVMEQVINGGLSSFSDPMKHVAKVIRMAEAGFMAAFTEGKISSFSYDPNISTVPSQKLTAYSLTENDILRQAIIRYQGAHPDVYVEYRVGMDEEGSATREDAVKKLNTEIMAGKGPDFLLLDSLPADSYVEKGVLADLTPYLAELEKEERILANIKESFTTDGKLCMIPAAVTVSMYMTDKENMAGVSDLSALADMIEKLRSEHPGEGILETYSEDMILNALMPVSAPLWFTESGQINAQELSDYLKQTKRIYDACMDGLPEELLQIYLGRAENWVGSSSEVGAYNDLQGGGLQIVAGNEKVALGELKNAYNYAFLKSVNKEENGENGVNCQTALTPGNVKDSFRPYALMGINAASGQAELAGGLLRETLSKELQSLIYPIGFPVNEEGLQTYLKTLGGQLSEDWAKPGEPYSGYGFSDENGLLVRMSIYVPTEQETQELYELLSSVRTPYLADSVVEDVVRENGKYYLEERCSLEEAVELVQSKIAIYMAE